MTHCKMFVVALVLLITAMTACAPNPKKSTGSAVTVSGQAGNFLMIKGHGFSENKDQNKVIFGDVSAQVLRAGPDYLLVQVPLQKATVVPVIVAVGKSSSNAMFFAYNPRRKLVAAVEDAAHEVY
jgi:hypothetical protein